MRRRNLVRDAGQAFYKAGQGISCFSSLIATAEAGSGNWQAVGLRQGTRQVAALCEEIAPIHLVIEQALGGVVLVPS